MADSGGSSAFSPGLALQGVGFGLSMYGGIEASAATQAAYQSQIQQVQTQQKINDVRQQFMQFSNERAQKQQVRQAQVARSMALSKSVQGGSQFSSGLQGAYGNISGQSGTNIAGLSGSFQYGNEVFGLEAQLTGEKEQQLHEQSLAASAQGIAAIGSGLMGLGGSNFLKGNG